MKRIWIAGSIAIGIVLLTSGMPVNSNLSHEKLPNLNDGITSSSCEVANGAFSDGEELTYKIYYNWNFIWLAAGEVTFRVREEGSSYRFSAEGRTYKVHEWLFKVRDSYECIADRETLMPLKANKRIEEGKYRMQEDIQFYRTQGMAVSKRWPSPETENVDTLSFDGCVQDILSALYATRNLDYTKMSIGDGFDVNILLDREFYPIGVKYFGLEKDVKIRKQGRYDAILFCPETQSGRVFGNGDQMKIWVSNDDNRIPLMVESPINVGSIKAVLKDARNLRHRSEL